VLVLLLAFHVFGVFPAIYNMTSDSSPLSSCKHTIAVIGAGGYIGSKVLNHFRMSAKGFDRNPSRFQRIHPENTTSIPAITKMASADIQIHELGCFKHILYLGGLTGRLECSNAGPRKVYEENVVDITRLAERMHAGQTLLFASTSAIAEGSGVDQFEEDEKVDTSLLDSYSYSLFQRENALRKISDKPDSPAMIGLRFGTVVGSSPSQRTDLLLMSMLRSAYTTGFIRVQNPDTHRAVLWIGDLVRAVEAIVNTTARERFVIYHLQSFDGSIIKFANHVAWRTEAIVHPAPGDQKSRGFSLNTHKFQTDYSFSFEGTVDKAVLELMSSGSQVISGRVNRELHHPHGTKPCVICGSNRMIRVLDLGMQPLANEFHSHVHDALACQRHKLQLVFCPVCFHSQLSHFVSRARLFVNYLYQSGTSTTLRMYFDWLAEKVVTAANDEAESVPRTVLEIACNDGTQLDSFLKHGWKTYGVDPAANLAQIARGKGHVIFTGFWGKDHFKRLPSTFDAIVAQNVLAHTDKPVDFMIQCSKYMSESTKLYIQTSQCEMYQSGQFDTIYHEHISFFTAHSFQELATRSALVITGFELVPVHGRSCLVTFQKRPVMNYGSSIFTAIALEKQNNIQDTWFYAQYEESVILIRQWMVKLLNAFSQKGYHIIGYGAAAKAIVFMQYLFSQPDFHAKFQFIIDDAPLKQNKYCAGTRIPVHDITRLKDRTHPTVVVVFAWNFFDEIKERIAKFITPLQGKLYILRPFPTQELYAISFTLKEGLLLRKVASNNNSPIPWNFHRKQPTDQNKVVMVSHFYNEQFLMPQFIQNHAPMFDEVILINQGSTDDSLKIIQSQAPPSWKVINSSLTMDQPFRADKVDMEVMAAENSLCADCWKISLTSTEFLVHRKLRSYLAEIHLEQVRIMKFPDLWMVGSERSPYNASIALPFQRAVFSTGTTLSNTYQPREFSRRIHRIPDLTYNIGRHFTSHDSEILPDLEWIPHGILLKYKHTPWPEIMARKLQIGKRIPPEHLANGWGVHHALDFEGLENERSKERLNTLIDLSGRSSQDQETGYKSSSNGIEDIFHKIWAYYFGYKGSGIVENFHKIWADSFGGDEFDLLL
jgi:nucleoside-diphosphate-sugar epimerase